MKTKSDRSLVNAALGGVADTIGKKKNGNFIARREFFYRHGQTKEKFAEQCSRALQAAGLKPQEVDAYEKWSAFSGGASTASSSHWGYEFKLLKPFAATTTRCA